MRRWWRDAGRAEDLLSKGHPVSLAYVCSRQDCGRFDADGGGCVPPIVGDWFCRNHLAEALEQRTERAP